jgi:hypothetical protein
MKAYIRKPSLFQERREVTLSEVRGVDRRSCVGGKYEALILVAVSENLHILELALKVRPQRLYGLRRQPDDTTAFLGFGLSKDNALAVVRPCERTPDTHTGVLQVDV